MNEQISIVQTREALKMMRDLVPILNKKELIELIKFNNKVLDRYVREHYPDGIQMEVAE